MEAPNALSRLTDLPALDTIAEPLSRAIRSAYDSAGPAGRRTNALHGVWSALLRGGEGRLGRVPVARLGIRHRG